MLIQSKHLKLVFYKIQNCQNGKNYVTDQMSYNKIRVNSETNLH